MKRTILNLILLAVSLSACAQGDPLRFDPSKGERQSLTMPDGKLVEYMAWEGIPYVANVEDAAYQCLNFYAPLTDADLSNAPILLRNNVGGYMAAKAMRPSPTDATGRALSEGYAVCIPGSRGSNSTVTSEADGTTVYTGRVPAGLLDLKAAVRYLRHNDDLMPGSAERIVSDGTSAGGAMSALLGATGNHPVYRDLLKAMGAADERDDIFAAVCYCPITDLDHADMAYEWLFSCTNGEERQLSPEQQAVSEELAAQYPAYLESLGLKAADGTLLTADNYLDYVKGFILQSAQRAVSETCQLPDSIGILMYEPQRGGGGPRGGFGRGGSEFVRDVDMRQYLGYVARVARLKTPPAFDSQGLPQARQTPENQAFGDSEGNSYNFTDYSLRKATGDPSASLSQEQRQRVWMMNPMNFITEEAASKAPHWYIRHGARDTDTSFPVPVNLATKLLNNGYDVDFALPWNRPHSGDYNLDDLFRWIARLLR
ncbi:MAG: alpha/beta hydrolase [Prevotellaceae bacterium]|nr:alpha/beta hydrolase [Prevotellaceae bacterium]